MSTGESRPIHHREELHRLIVDLELKLGVEVGTQRAEYAVYLLENTDLYLHLVDIWQYQENYDDLANVPDEVQESYLLEALHNLAPYSGRYSIIRKFSMDAAKGFSDESLDFVYIDANHSYASTTADLEAWYPKIRAGGLVSGHDFLDSGSNFGVKSAVTDFLANKGHKLYITREQWPSWYFTK